MQECFVFTEGDPGECKEMQELPGHADEASVQWHTISQHGPECSRSCQGPPGVALHHVFTVMYIL